MPRPRLRLAPRALGAAVLAMLVVSSAPSLGADGEAESKRQAAQAALTDGNQRFGREDYQGALEAYRQAFAQFPSAKLYFNIGQAHRALGNLVDATEAYEAFLSECSDAGADLRAEAEGYLKELRREVGRIALVSDVEGAEVRVDGEARGRTPLVKPLVVRAGKRRVSVEKAGYARREEDVTVAAGEEAALAVTLAPVVPVASALVLQARPAPELATPAPAPASKPVYKRWWFWTGVAALAAVAVAGTVHAMSSSDLACPATVQHCYDAR